MCEEKKLFAVIGVYVQLYFYFLKLCPFAKRSELDNTVLRIVTNATYVLFYIITFFYKTTLSQINKVVS